MMRSHSSNFKSRPKNRTRTPKYYRRPSATPQDTSQSDIENIRERRSHSSRNLAKHLSDHNIFFHHHQHHHNVYLPRNGCECKKFLIYAILFFLAYYLLFVAVTTTYRHNIYSKNLRTPHIPEHANTITDHSNGAVQSQLKQLFESREDPSLVNQPDHIKVNLPNIPNIQSSELQKALTSRSDEHAQAIAERRQRRKRHRQEVRKLKPFPQMYLSDNPYYLDKNLVMVGQVKDAEKRIDMILYQLESIACLFNSTTFILFESNSEDKTLLHLQRWSLRRPLNCTQIAFKPEINHMYGEIDTLEELIDVFKPHKYETDHIYDYDMIDEIIAQYLGDTYDSIKDINVYDISAFLSHKLRLDEFEEIEIEEILYEKLMPIKYVKYKEKIYKHTNTMFKHVLSGDKMVTEELAVEEEILRQLRVYGSLNELHSGYNVMEELAKQKESEAKRLEMLMSSNDTDIENIIDENGDIVAIFMDERVNANELDMEFNFIQGIKQSELMKHSHSDFVQEFGGIHDELEGLIQYDEAIIHEKLRERKRKYEERRRRERTKRESEIMKSQSLIDTINERMNGNNGIQRAEWQRERLERVREEERNEGESADSIEEGKPLKKFRDKLFRIERFVIYRNMLLNHTQYLSRKLGISFDYILVIDMDIYSIDVRTFMNELYFMPQNIDGICIDGIDWMGYTRDTFATVKVNGGWLHYGHDSLVNNTKYIYDNQRAMEARTKVPNQNYRFEEVKSCFGGIMIYKNFDNNLLNQQCRYTLTRDVFYTNYNNSEDSDSGNVIVKTESNINGFDYTFDYWFEHRYHNPYTEQSKLEMKLFIKQYIELLQVFDKTVMNRELIPRDGDICEHIPYHYCLWDKGFKFAIATRAKLYYDKFYPINRNDTNWAHYIQNRAKFTQ